MARRICVNLEPIGGIRIVSRFQNPGTESNCFLVSFLQVFYVHVQMELLLRRSIWPLGRDMVWRQLEGKSPHAIDYHAVPVIVSMDLAIQ